ncbi:hypothetical protein JCM10449v2_001537 [Rhodotorula kratochvilovae]
MTSGASAGLPLPERDEHDDPTAIQQAHRKLAALRVSRRVNPLGAKGRGGNDDLEVLGEPAGKEDGEDEVGDEWFALPDEQTSRTVRLSIGKVPRRAGTRIKRTLRGNKRKGVPAVGVEEVDDGALDALELDETGTGLADAGSLPSTASFTDGRPLRDSPSASADSLVSLELPPLAPSTSSSSRGSHPSSRPLFTQLSALPTLSELRTASSTASSSPATSVHAPDPPLAPARTLTIDERITRVARRDTRSSIQHLSHKHGLRFPGRSTLPRQKKHAARSRAQADAAEMDEAVAEALQKAGLIVEEKDRVVVEVLYEHQRGLVVFGLPKFSSNALFQVDPPQWCDEQLKPSPFTPHTFPCPPYWVWRDSEFMVDMGGDKDEEGWSYAVRFRSRFWRGEAITLRSFVRRRRWVRTRVYRPRALPLAPSSSAPESQTPPSPDPADACDSVGGITDLQSACAALPLEAERRAALLAESSSPAAYLVGEIPPRNPFVSYRAIKLEAAAAADSLREGGALASTHEPRWRDAVRELNFRRAAGVLRAHACIDRQRLELWRLWVGAREGGAAVPAVKDEAGEGPAAGTTRMGGRAVEAAKGVAERRERTEVWDEGVGAEDEPEREDVWDVIEGRLDAILSLFDYHHTRLLFLGLILSQHPMQDAAHRYAGYDAPSEARRDRLERGLAERLTFYDGVKRLAEEYGARGAWIGEHDVEKEGAYVEKEALPSEKGRRKGKKRAD